MWIYMDIHIYMYEYIWIYMDIYGYIYSLWHINSKKASIGVCFNDIRLILAICLSRSVASRLQLPLVVMEFWKLVVISSYWHQ